MTHQGVSVQIECQAARGSPQAACGSNLRGRHFMRKILVLALIALALAGGVAAGTSLLSPRPAHADCNTCS